MVLAYLIVVGTLDLNPRHEVAFQSAPSTTSAPAPSRTVKPSEAPALTPDEFGATGDGVHDDSVPVQRALDRVRLGGTVEFKAGEVYRHSVVLVVRVAGTHLTGSGVLLATDESRSSVWISANNVLVDGGLDFKTARTTRRWPAYEQMGLRLDDAAGVILRNITVEGSAAAGIYIGGSSNFLVENVSVSNTRADGIHITGGSHNGTLRRVSISRSGDDGVSVVSYQQDGAVCNNILIDSPVVRTTTGGRGLSVVGGTDITYRNVKVDSSSAAAIYVANEGAPYFTYSSTRISYLGGTLTRSNTDSHIDHGAILIYSSRPGFTVSDVTIDGMIVSGTRPSASRQVGVLRGDGSVSGVVLSHLTIRGGGTPFYANVPGSDYSTLTWLIDGKFPPDHLAKAR